MHSSSGPFKYCNKKLKRKLKNTLERKLGKLKKYKVIYK
jgi:hypothetical protein